MNKQTKTIKFNNEMCTLTTDVRDRAYYDNGRHTYVSVSCDFNPEDIQGSGFTCHPEWSLKGEDPANDKLWRKYNKMEISLQKDLINKAIELEMIPANVMEGLSFSRKAGCSCGCSPGWKSRDYRRRDIWIRLVSPSKEAEREALKKEQTSNHEAKTLASMVI